MRSPIAYMLTWTTYGSWLQGDKRGYVKDGVIHNGNKMLTLSNKSLMRHAEVSLTPAQRRTVEDALLKEAEVLGQKIYAMTIHKNHVHLVVGPNAMEAGVAVSHYKNAARLAIQKKGFCGKLWTRGFSKRYCFDKQRPQSIIAYINDHKKTKSPQVHPGG